MLNMYSLFGQTIMIHNRDPLLSAQYILLEDMRILRPMSLQCPENLHTDIAILYNELLTMSYSLAANNKTIGF